MLIAKLTRRNTAASQKVRIVYQGREHMIVTVLLLKLDSDRPNKLKTLTICNQTYRMELGQDFRSWPVGSAEFGQEVGNRRRGRVLV